MATPFLANREAEIQRALGSLETRSREAGARLLTLVRAHGEKLSAFQALDREIRVLERERAEAGRAVARLNTDKALLQVELRLLRSSRHGRAGPVYFPPP